MLCSGGSETPLVGSNANDDNLDCTSGTILILGPIMVI